MRSSFLFGVWPYVALVVLVVVFMVRYALSRLRSSVTEYDPSEALAGFGGGRWWLAGLLMLFIGHLAGLAFPGAILHWDAVTFRLYGLEGAAFAIGLLVLTGCCGVMWRSFQRSSGSVAGQIADVAFLSVFLVAIVSGLLTAAIYRWGSSWGVLILTPYILSLLRGDPALALAVKLPFFVQLHVFSSMTTMAVLPFTRVAPFIFLGINRLLGIASRPVSALTRSGRPALEALRRTPGVWIWPEED